MAIKTKKQKAKKLTVPAPKAYVAEAKVIHLEDIAANTGQSRGMGVLPVLQDMGYGLFDSPDEDKSPLWPMFFSDDPEERVAVCRLLEENEKETVVFAEKQRNFGQLQPIGVVPIDQDHYDVVFGMRRSVARAYLAAKYGTEECPATIEAKVFGGELNALELKLMSLAENDERQGESPMDRAIAYQQLKDMGLTPAQIGGRIKKSDQHVRDYLALLDPLLEDKRMAIHTGTLKVDPALAELSRRKARKEGGGSPARKARTEDAPGRFHWPSVKTAVKAYETGVRPKSVSDEEWELWKDPQVRRFIAIRLGLEITEYQEPQEGAEAEEDDDVVPVPKAREKAKAKNKGKAEANGKHEGDGKADPALRVTRPVANNVLLCLGVGSPQTLSDEDVREKLEGIVSLADAEEAMEKMETKPLRKAYQSLLDAYKEGRPVKVVKA